MRTLEHPTKAIKEAPTRTPVHPLIRARFSTRSFGAEPVTQEELDTLFEAAAWAPSSMNEQPWRFRYALQGTAAFGTLAELLMPGNRPWAEHAAVLVAISGMKHHARNGQPNATWQHDVGLATANLVHQATAMELFGHLMGGFDHARVQEMLHLDPAKEEVVTVLALGRLGEAEALDEPYRTRELSARVRKPLEETAIALI